MRYVVVGVVILGLALFVLGPFALPAVIGVLMTSVIAARRGLGYDQALRLIVPVAVLLLVAGLVLSMLFVPTARMVRGSAGSRDWVVAPTSAPVR